MYILITKRLRDRKVNFENINRFKTLLRNLVRGISAFIARPRESPFDVYLQCASDVRSYLDDAHHYYLCVYIRVRLVRYCNMDNEHVAVTGPSSGTGLPKNLK